MSPQTPTRRTFLQGGALLAVPAFAAAAVATPIQAAPQTGTATRAPEPQAETVIRNLHQTWLRRIDSGYRDPLLDSTVRRITADPAGETDRIKLATDGSSATGQFDCLVELQTPLAPDSTLAQMAHAQGHGAVSRTERRRLNVGYTLNSDGWRIARVDFETA